MERTVRIFHNTSAQEVFDPQLGVTFAPGESKSFYSQYHMPPSKPEIVDVTNDPPVAEENQAEPELNSAVTGVLNAVKVPVTEQPTEGSQDAQQ